MDGRGSSKSPRMVAKWNTISAKLLRVKCAHGTFGFSSKSVLSSLEGDMVLACPLVSAGIMNESPCLVVSV